MCRMTSERLQSDVGRSVERVRFNFKGRSPAQQNIADLINDALNDIAKVTRRCDDALFKVPSC